MILTDPPFAHVSPIVAGTCSVIVPFSFAMFCEKGSSRHNELPLLLHVTTAGHGGYGIAFCLGICLLLGPCQETLDDMTYK